MDREIMYQIRESFHRCLESNIFFESFYKRFLSSSDEIAAKFKEVDMSTQHAMIAEGITKLLTYAETGEPGNRLEQVARLHARSRLNIEPRFYDVFTTCLVETLKEVDSAMTPEVEKGWHECIKKGTDFMAPMYESE